MKKAIINDYDETCTECEKDFPFTSAYFIRTRDHKDLQNICIPCNKHRAQRGYRERKRYGKVLTKEERIQIKLKKEQEKEENMLRKIEEDRKIKEEREERKRLSKIKPATIVCGGCEEEKEFTPDNFPKDSSRRWGLIQRCKTCMREQRIKNKRLPHNKAHKNIRKALGKYLNDLGSTKVILGMTTHELLGCTGEEFVKHLNSGEYTLEDYNTNNNTQIYFHIDHIIPKKHYEPYLQFDINGKPTEETLVLLKKCWNYKNLRICPAEENMIKGDTLHMDLVDKYNIHHLLP